MSTSSLSINDSLPSQVLQKIFLLSTESLNDALLISTTCRLWRKLIFNPFMIEHYWTFDDEHRKKGLLRWWNFDGNVTDQSDLFVNFTFADCFLGKCASLTHIEENSEEIDIAKSQITIDRSSDYTLALWLLITKTEPAPRCVFMVCDDDWDYARSAGVAVDENDFLSTVFASSISERIIKSNVQIKPNQWFHIVLVQERELDEEMPRQHLWINGQLELTVEVPIAAFSSTAVVSFRFLNEWNHSVADISLWSRRLLPLEIRSIYEQKTSIDKVNIAKYIFEHLKC